MTQTTVEITKTPPTPTPTPTPIETLVRRLLLGETFEAAVADSDVATVEYDVCNDATKPEMADSVHVDVSVADPILVSVLVRVREMRLVAVGNISKSILTVRPRSGFCSHAAFNTLTSGFSSVRTSKRSHSMVRYLQFPNIWASGAVFIQAMQSSKFLKVFGASQYRYCNFAFVSRSRSVKDILRPLSGPAHTSEHVAFAGGGDVLLGYAKTHQSKVNFMLTIETP